MPGAAKRIFEARIRDIKSEWNKELKELSAMILPKNYTHEDIIALLQKYYPFEWKTAGDLYIYYGKLDEGLRKARYNMKCPKDLLKEVPKYREIMKIEYRKKYAEMFSESVNKRSEEELWEKRFPKIERIKARIEKAKSRTQQVTPDYISKIIALYYNCKNLKDKMYILKELERYYCKDIIEFMSKINDTEINEQLRDEAFYHLQGFGYAVRKRKQKYIQCHGSKKKKVYLRNVFAKQTCDIKQTPENLEYNIENSVPWESIKSFDYFISHSSKDYEYVQALIKAENKAGKNIYCDWINDIDYLKRHLLCEATLKVIEERLKQSVSMIFVDSDYSKYSPWCKYELNYFYEMGKPIYVISVSDIEKGNFELSDFDITPYIDSDYKKFAIKEGRNIRPQE